MLTRQNHEMNMQGSKKYVKQRARLGSAAAEQSPKIEVADIQPNRDADFSAPKFMKWAMDSDVIAEVG